MRFSLKSKPPSELYLGRQGENAVKVLEFNMHPLVLDYGIGSLSLVYKRTETETPYLVPLDIIDDIAYWNVSNTDTDVAGNGEAQFTYAVGDKVKKTIIYKTKVMPSLLPASGDAPDPFNNWLDQLREIGGQIVASKNQALFEIANSKEDALADMRESRESALSAINEDGTAYVNSIRTDGSSYVRQIQEDGTDALSDISSARINALDDMQTAETDALSAMTQKVTQAEAFAESAEGFAELAEQYKNEARSYAENLHFTDSNGDIIISIGG